MTLIDARRPEWADKEFNPSGLAEWLGLDPHFPGLVAWDVFDAVLTPGDVILMMCWRDPEDAPGRSGKKPRYRTVHGIAAFASSATTECSTAAKPRSITQTQSSGPTDSAFAPAWNALVLPRLLENQARRRVKLPHYFSLKKPLIRAGLL